VATWIAHLRIAEGLISRGLPVSLKGFVVGSVAPDAGVPSADRSSFTPPTEITHWRKGNEICHQCFYNSHVADLHSLNTYESSFLVGYYTHLLSDMVWTNQVFLPKLDDPIYRDNLANDAQFIWTIKKDWYGQDIWYLQDHPDSLFFQHFLSLTQAADVLDYFPSGAVQARVDSIKEYYLSRLIGFDPSRPWLYLTKTEMDDFVKIAIDECYTRLQRFL